MTESTGAPTRILALSLDDWTTAYGDPPREALEPVCRATLSKTAPRLFSYSRPSDRWGFFIVEPAVAVP
jgi:hypothetical protein